MNLDKTFCASETHNNCGIQSSPVSREMPSEDALTEIAAKSLKPDLFSDDADVAHRAASPISVKYARQHAMVDGRRIARALIKHMEGK